MSMKHPRAHREHPGRADALTRPAGRTLLWLLVLVGALLTTSSCAHTAARPEQWMVPEAGEAGPILELLAGDSRAGPLQEWVRARANRYGIPERALQAYGQASLATARATPGCHLGWTTLAAIGRVESDHGRHQGSRIAADGRVSPPIRGAPLDGTHGNARILDPVATATAGRTIYATAQGPFQFIPDTWQRWGTRADHQYPANGMDTTRTIESEPSSGSPDDIDDAALAAARYLCAAGGNLATAAGWRSAVYAYNHSDAYVRKIYETAASYAR